MIKISIRTSTTHAAQRIIQRIPAAEMALSRAVLASCEPYVPYRTGELCRSGTAGRGVVRYTAGHAEKCYYSKKPFSKAKHPQACAYWFEAAKAVDLPAWKNAAALALSGAKTEGGAIA